MKVLENMLLNLKIISKIPENGRIKRAEAGTLALDENENFKWLKRFINGDNRKKAIDDINNTIDFIVEKCHDILNYKYFEYNKVIIENSFIKNKLDNEYYKNSELIEIIYNDLKNCIKGLLNLKTTYHTDATSVSRIDILITKIKNFISELEKKINEDNKLSDYIDEH